MITIKHRTNGSVLLSIDRTSLKGADLSQQALNGKDLCGADLANQDLTGCSFVETDLTGADLSGAKLIGADLTKAIFCNARMVEVDMTCSNLAHTSFQHTNMRGAILKDTKNLTALQVSAANLEGIQPSDIVKFEGITHADEAIKNVSKILLAILLACAFTAFITENATDAQILTQSGTTKLPILNFDLSINAFIFLAPFVLLIAYAVLLLDLLKTREALVSLPAIFPDGTPLDRKTQPWLLSAALRASMPRLREIDEGVEYAVAKPTSFVSLQRYLASFIAYWIVPITIFIVGERYVVMHSLISFWHAMLIGVSIGLAITLNSVSKKVLAGELTVEATSSSIAWGMFMCLLGFSSFAHWCMSVQDTHGDYQNLPYPWKAVIREWQYDATLPNIENMDVSSKPDKWTGGKHPEELDLVKGAKLDHQNLERTYGNGAFLVKADLKFAHLSQGNLRNADLRQAILDNADLEGATLGAANLAEASLKQAKMGEAELFDADLKAANLEGADLHKVNLSGADLRRANMLRINLRDANIDHTDFRQAKNLTWTAIISAANWQLAYLPDDLLQKQPLSPWLPNEKIKRAISRLRAIRAKRDKQDKLMNIQSITNG